jgi:hypothetical protein
MLGRREPEREQTRRQPPYDLCTMVHAGSKWKKIKYKDMKRTPIKIQPKVNLIYGYQERNSYIL